MNRTTLLRVILLVIIVLLIVLLVSISLIKPGIISLLIDSVIIILVISIAYYLVKLRRSKASISITKVLSTSKTRAAEKPTAPESVKAAEKPTAPESVKAAEKPTAPEIVKAAEKPTALESIKAIEKPTATEKKPSEERPEFPTIKESLMLQPKAKTKKLYSHVIKSEPSEKISKEKLSKEELAKQYEKLYRELENARYHIEDIEQISNHFLNPDFIKGFTQELNSNTAMREGFQKRKKPEESKTEVSYWYQYLQRFTPKSEKTEKRRTKENLTITLDDALFSYATVADTNTVLQIKITDDKVPEKIIYLYLYAKTHKQQLKLGTFNLFILGKLEDVISLNTEQKEYFEKMSKSNEYNRISVIPNAKFNLNLKAIFYAGSNINDLDKYHNLFIYYHVAQTLTFEEDREKQKPYYNQILKTYISNYDSKSELINSNEYRKLLFYLCLSIILFQRNKNLISYYEILLPHNDNSSIYNFLNVLKYYISKKHLNISISSLTKETIEKLRPQTKSKKLKESKDS
jgi:chemotaxis protein histidine kinase CheA